MPLLRNDIKVLIRDSVRASEKNVKILIKDTLDHLLPTLSRHSLEPTSGP